MAWVWWTCAGVIVVSLVLLGLSGRALARRVPPLLSALTRLQRRAAQAEGVALGAERLRERVTRLEQSLSQSHERS